MRHELRVPKGYENRPEVQRAYGQLVARYGRDNVDFVIEEPPSGEDPDPDDDAGRRTVRDPTDEGE